MVKRTDINTATKRNNIKKRKKTKKNNQNSNTQSWKNCNFGMQCFADSWKSVRLHSASNRQRQRPAELQAEYLWLG